MEVWLVYTPNSNYHEVFSTHGKARAYKESLERDGIDSFVEQLTVNAATPEPKIDL